MKNLHLLGSVLTAAATSMLATRPTNAYQRYQDGCNNSACHGVFTTNPYSSPKGGANWPTSLHEVHRSSSYMSTACGLCHLTGDQRNPYTNKSDGTASTTGHGCVGCHGNDYNGTVSGRGLRAHHVAKGVTICTGTCHTAATPAPESVKPPYYGSPDTKVNYPCNDDANTSEDWSGDGVGLDNDGDLKYDKNDPDCAASTGGTGGTSTGGTGGTGGTSTGGTGGTTGGTGGTSTGGTGGTSTGGTGGTKTGGTGGTVTGGTGGTTTGGTGGTGGNTAGTGGTNGGTGGAVATGGTSNGGGGGAPNGGTVGAAGMGGGGAPGGGGQSGATGGSATGGGGNATSAGGSNNTGGLATAGESATAGSGAVSSGSGDKGGCGCRTAGESSMHASISAVLAMLGLAFARRRRIRR